MIKKVCCTILCVCLLAALIGCGSADEVEETTTTAVETEATTTEAETEEITTVAETEEITTVAEAEDEEYTPVNADALWGTEYDGYKVEVLSYTYENDWKCNEDDPGTSAVCIRFYFENGNDAPLYLQESFAISVYQDGVEQEYIEADGDNEEVLNVGVSVKDGAGIYCLMAFELTSDSDAELLITEPTADANLLLEMELVKDESTAAKEYAYDVVLYSDSCVEITLVSITLDNAYFSITNVSDQTLQISCEYFQLDDTEYTYEDTNYSTPIMLIVSGDTLEYEFCDYDTGNEIDFEIINPDFDVFSGSFEILDGEGYQIEYASITDVSVN